ncbi:TetR/AcrR family transcriptional regulator [Paraferrimonas sedimenticola]|uniref:TetR family transcriptional regulator n=1 Tax=Paraferrimonas sedimenticola TaxID=375674 RepID=A0AA37W066_9GAMM|nr:TetR/AcrR family transcriptional regulator [Paraferrimonas sedimenticola]GLP95965.1 TetR family transcriptional regulator [Paraferrimonas sedimenticola]
MSRTIKPADERRRELLNAARHLFFDRGYDNTSINDILNVVGLSKGAFYHHFSSKNALLDGLVDHEVADLYQATKAACLQPGLTALQRWQRLFERSAQWELANKTNWIVLLTSLYRDENLRYRLKLTQAAQLTTANLFSQVITQGVDEGSFSVTDPKACATILVSAHQALSDRIAELLLSQQNPAALDQIHQLCQATQELSERALGAPKGSLPIVDRATLAAWFQSQESPCAD